MTYTTVIAVLALAVQASLVLWMLRTMKGRALSSLGCLLILALFVYHGCTVILGRLSDRPKPAYFGLSQIASDSGHIAATAMLAALAIGYVVGMRRSRAGSAHALRPTDTTSLPEAVWWACLALMTVAVTAATGLFNIRSSTGAAASSAESEAAFYFLYPTLALAGAHWTVRLADSGKRWAVRSPLIAACGITVLSGRRLWVIVVALTVLAALPEPVRRLLGRRFLLVGSVLAIGVAVWTVSLRVYIREGPRVVSANNPYERYEGLGSILTQYVDFLGQPSAWVLPEEMLEDLSYRADGHVFLAHVISGQLHDEDPLRGSCFLANTRFVIPSVFWPEKKGLGLEYCEDMSVRVYRMPPIDYTPTIIGETTADTGPYFATVLFFAIGYLLERLDAWLRQRSFRTRALFICTVGQAIIVAESGWLGVMLAIRTLLILAVAIGLARLAWGEALRHRLAS